MKVRIGVDIGKDGGIAVFIDGIFYQAYRIPKIGDEIDVAGLAEFIVRWKTNLDLHVCIEDVHSIYGSSANSNFQFGRSLGIIEGILAAAAMPTTKVAPKTWQKLMWLGVPEQTKISKGKEKKDTKAMSLIAAKRLYPNLTFLATERSTVPHDGIVDAVLIATYCNRTH